MESSGRLSSGRTLFSISSLLCLAGLPIVAALERSNFFATHVYLVTPQWKELFGRLLGNAESGLLLAGLILALIAYWYAPIIRGIDRFLSSKEKSFLVVLFCGAFLIRVLYLLIFRTQPWSDQLWYQRAGLQLAAGMGYLNEAGLPTAYYPIGFPLYLSLLYRAFGDNLWIIKASNVILNVATIGMLYALTKRLMGERVARIAAILNTLCLSQIAFSDTMFSEVTFLFFFTATLAIGVRLLEERERDVLPSIFFGIILGISCLIRPAAIVILLALFIMSVKSSVVPATLIRKFIIIGIFMAIVLTPNIMRNYGLFGKFIPVSTNGGVDFWIGNNPRSSGHYMAATALDSAGAEDAISSAGYKAGASWIVSHPLEALVNEVRKFLHLYARDDEGIIFSFTNVEGSAPWFTSVPLLLLGDLGYYIVLALFCRNMWRRKRTLNVSEQYFLHICILTTAFYLIYFGSERFHFALLPIFCMFAAKEIDEQKLI
jgi:hypothetical protein